MISAFNVVRRRSTLCLAVALTIAAPVYPHDLWIIPGKFAIQPGEKVRVFINSGDTFPVSDALVNAARIGSLTFHPASSGKSEMTSFVADGMSLTAEITATEPGTSALTLALEPRVIRLKAEEFNQYLADEGLLRLLELREARGESKEPAVERYTKWAKAILNVGDESDGRWSESTGLRLEVVPHASPHTLRRGATLPFVVLFEGKPLPVVTVVGGRAGTPAHRVKAVTDSNGEASVVLEEAGRWYLRALHVIRLRDDPEAQWESFWTTITFEVQT
ncbi:MAG TPA: DUF4198 domain-containing protein [Vicinamibacteria bacterium]